MRDGAQRMRDQNIEGVITMGMRGPGDVSLPPEDGVPLIQDLISGQIDMTFGQAANYLNPVRSGQLKAYAVLAAKRWWASPETPTIVEAGGPALYSSFWHGLWVPKNTPKDVIAKLNAAVSQALDDPVLKKRFSDIGQEIWPKDQQNPAALAAQQKAEIERWWPIIKEAGIKTE